MWNQKRLLASLAASMMMIVMVTVVMADDASFQNQGTAVQGSNGIALCADDAESGEIAVMSLDRTEDNTETEEKEETETATEADADADETAEPAEEEKTGTVENGKKDMVTLDAEQAPQTETLWKLVYADIMYEKQLTGEKLIALALAEAKSQGIELMSCATDHIVNYHGTRYVISDDEYQVLLRIVEAEAPEEDAIGRMLIANVILNRVHAEQFPDTISGVVFQKGQFSPVSDGMYFKRTVSEETIEAVERVLAGEDHSQGALYFVARSMTKKSSLKFFDEKLVRLFKHGVHTFYTEK